MSDGEFGEGLVQGGISSMIGLLVESIENYVFLEHIVERIELKHVHDKSSFVSVQCSNGSSWEANRA
jgi:hypothetical protein